MKHQKPLAVRIFIRICVVFMTVSLIGVYVVYMFAPTQEAWEDNQWADVDTWSVENISWENTAGESQVILPEIDSENPESTQAPILVTEDGEVNEMDQMVEVQLENGETELVRQWDLWDAIQIAQ
jgi:hypothetical protein